MNKLLIYTWYSLISLMVVFYSVLLVYDYNNTAAKKTALLESIQYYNNKIVSVKL